MSEETGMNALACFQYQFPCSKTSGYLSSFIETEKDKLKVVNKYSATTKTYLTSSFTVNEQKFL